MKKKPMIPNVQGLPVPVVLGDVVPTIGSLIR